MKPQDLVFIVVLIIFLLKRDVRLFILGAIACFFIAIPLFYTWKFFTAERLIYYAFFLLLVAMLLFFLKKR